MSHWKTEYLSKIKGLRSLSIFSLTLMADLLPPGDHVLLTLSLLYTPDSSWNRMVAFFPLAFFTYSG